MGIGGEVQVFALSPQESIAQASADQEKLTACKRPCQFSREFVDRHGAADFVAAQSRPASVRLRLSLVLASVVAPRRSLW
jgi:hypothetical protein